MSPLRSSEPVVVTMSLEQFVGVVSIALLVGALLAVFFACIVGRR